MRTACLCLVLAFGNAARGQEWQPPEEPKLEWWEEEDVVIRAGHRATLRNFSRTSGNLTVRGGVLLLIDSWVEDGVDIYGGEVTMIRTYAHSAHVVTDGGKLTYYGNEIPNLVVSGEGTRAVVYGKPPGLGQSVDVRDGGTLDLFLSNPRYEDGGRFIDLPYGTYTKLPDNILTDHSTYELDFTTVHIDGGTVNIHPYAVPEPSSATLFLLGLLGLRRRR